ncbi:MAG: hypothetical protein WDM90_18515 [Ferruginibacter sp.]
MFYWSSLGGNNLYWMSSTDEQEYGDWFAGPGEVTDPNEKNKNVKDFEEIIRLKHKDDFAEISKYHGTAKDDVYAKFAIRNIKAHPIKFLQNCFSNLGRFFFNYPYSYKLQNPGTLLRLPFSGTLFICMLFCIVQHLKTGKK